MDEDEVLNLIEMIEIWVEDNPSVTSNTPDFVQIARNLRENISNL